MSQKLEFTKTELETMKKDILSANNIFEMHDAVGRYGIMGMEARMAFLSALFGIRLPSHASYDVCAGYEKILKYLLDEYEETA